MTEIKYVIKSLCTLLLECGFTYIPAEAIRLAKFDRDCPCQLLWDLLAELFSAKQLNWIIRHKDLPRGFYQNNDEKIKFVKYSLLTEGYSCEIVSNLSPDHGSRALLIAFGWFLAKTRFVDQIVRLKIAEMKNRWEKDLVEDQRKNLYTRCKSLNKIMEKSLEKKVPTLPELCDKLIWLKGKAKMSTRNLYDAYEEELQLTNTILSMKEIELSNFSFLSPKLELLLATQPMLQNQFMKMLDMEMNYFNLFLNWKKNENLFWQWMLTVLNAEEETASETRTKSNSNKSETTETSECFIQFDKTKIATQEFENLRKITFLPHGIKTKNHKSVLELYHKLTQQKIQLETELGQKKQMANKHLIKSCDNLQDIICIPPI